MPEFIYLKPSTRLSRAEATAALIQAGYHVSKSTLAQLAHRREGPGYYLFNAHCFYVWSETLAWAEGACQRINPVERAAGMQTPGHMFGPRAAPAKRRRRALAEAEA
jgi:hypothetical protein